jgi:hypothetical protein
LYFKKEEREMAKKTYPDYISKKRIPVAPPEKLVVDGQAVFGTFDSEIPVMNLLDLNNKPQKKNLGKYTEWEALELSFEDFTLLTAVYATGPIGFTIMVFFDKALGKVTNKWIKIGLRSSAKVAKNLIYSDTEMYLGKTEYCLTNRFKEGKAFCKANSKGKSGEIDLEVELTNLSDPSVVSIPFGDNLPLYSQKNIFAVKGYVSINGKKYEANEKSMAIIDDHKGYYPHYAHYDWLTTMGKIEENGELKTFGFNLTRNQSINQDDFNENLIWLDKDSSPLPPVVFTHDEEDPSIWYVKDELGKVDVKFVIEDTFKIVANAGIIMMKYYLPFGKISGKVVDVNGKEYIVDGMMGIGEDKTTKM